MTWKIWLVLAVVLLISAGTAWFTRTTTEESVTTSLREEYTLAEKATKAKARSSSIKNLTEYQLKRNSRLPLELAELQSSLIHLHTEKTGVPLPLVVGMIEAETLFLPHETSKAGAKGLMQLYVGEVEIDSNRVYDIAYNIETGIIILQEKLNKHNGNMAKALEAYSGGARGYVEKVYQNVGRFVTYCSLKEK